MSFSAIASAPALELCQQEERLEIIGRHFRLGFSRSKGAIDSLRLYDGISWNQILKEEVGLNLNLPAESFEISEGEHDSIVITVQQGDEDWEVATRYEVYPRGYVIASFRMATRRDGARPLSLAVRMVLEEATVFSRPHRILNESPQPEMRQAVRGFSVNFTTDHRPVTHSVDLLLEQVSLNANGKPPLRYITSRHGGRELGWKLTTGWPYPFADGFSYENRWCISFTAPDHRPNPVRGQRIYQWFGNIAEGFAPPDAEQLLEMAEYGASILIMHLPVLSQIDVQEARDPLAMERCVQEAHRLGIKILLYAQPYLIRRTPCVPERFRHQRTECLNVWNAMTECQITSYLPDFTENDCDELNLRHPEAFAHIRDGALDCMTRYAMDGLYIDFAWPAQGLALNPENGLPGMFNFHDYLRLLREWRAALGPEKIMIGHGGGFLVGSDMVEGFDACLTGEAQRTMTAETLGTHYGTAPGLWIIQRNKRDLFRSARTLGPLVREGVTPHVGLGVCGKAIIATVDPGYFPELMALWQMWRAFPMEEATCYDTLAAPVLSLDNEEIAYTLYRTPRGEILLLLVNEGGPRLDDSPAIGVNIDLDLTALGLPEELRVWRMRGQSYETFRITEMEPITAGHLAVYEIDHRELQGYILSADEPPATLTALQEHLAGRAERLGPLLRQKQERLVRLDHQLDTFARLPHAHQFFSYSEFMAGRVAE